MSQEARELLQQAGEGDMSRGAERLVYAWAWARLLRSAGHKEPGDIFDFFDEEENPYAFRCPQCGGLATVWEPLDDFLRHSQEGRQHWRCWRGHEGWVEP